MRRNDDLRVDGPRLGPGDPRLSEDALCVHRTRSSRAFPYDEADVAKWRQEIFECMTGAADLQLVDDEPSPVASEASRHLRAAEALLSDPPIEPEDYESELDAIRTALTERERELEEARELMSWLEANRDDLVVQQRLDADIGMPWRIYDCRVHRSVIGRTFVEACAKARSASPDAAP